MHIVEFARLNFQYTLLSKRKLAWFVEQGVVDGWQDPRFPTVAGMLRRCVSRVCFSCARIGSIVCALPSRDSRVVVCMFVRIRLRFDASRQLFPCVFCSSVPCALLRSGLLVDNLREFMISQGASKRVVDMEWDKFWSNNARKLDPITPRFQAVNAATAVPLTLLGGEHPVGARAFICLQSLLVIARCVYTFARTCVVPIRAQVYSRLVLCANEIRNRMFRFL